MPALLLEFQCLLHYRRTTCIEFTRDTSLYKTIHSYIHIYIPYNYSIHMHMCRNKSTPTQCVILEYSSNSLCNLVY